MLHPPLRESRFWAIQAVVLLIVTVHFLIDVDTSFPVGIFPAGIPVALLVLPIGYAGLRYGLAGSSATAVWATLLWLPDLLLPHDQGHVGADVLNLAIVLVVSFVFGQRIEAERFAHQRSEEAARLALAVEAGYRRLFETNHSPILVLDEHGVVADANPAAVELLGARVLGSTNAGLAVEGQGLEGLSGRVLTLPNGHDYRLDLSILPATTSGPRSQLNFEDVTEERTEQRRARHFAQLVVQAEEDQRHRLARELHDEPLQLFLHLARRLEVLAHTRGVPPDVASGLALSRHQALDAAGRLRNLARDLRPPALDELGLNAALSSLVADIEDENDEGPSVEMLVLGRGGRLDPEIELGAFRIVQESLRNALRHAKAHHLHLTIEYRPTELALRVSDDGQGFDATSLGEDSTRRSLGLVGMRERTRLLGGTLDVRSSAGVGTVVEAALPLDPSREHDALATLA
jgi:signal transduction histidine kinase